MLTWLFFFVCSVNYSLTIILQKVFFQGLISFCSCLLALSMERDYWHEHRNSLPEFECLRERHWPLYANKKALKEY